MSVSSQVSTARKKKGMTQEELAELAQVTVRTIQRVESGESTPRAYTLKLIATALELPFEQFAKPAAEKPQQEIVVEPVDTIEEDRHFLQMVGLSCFTFIVIPYVHFLIPRYIIKKSTGVSKHTKLLAEKWIRVQIWWVVILHLSLLVLLTYNIILYRTGNIKFTIGYLWLILMMYLFNTILIVHGLLKSRHFTRQ